MISKKFTAYLFYVLIFALSLSGIVYANSFTVGINYSNADPVVLVDEDGLTINGTNPLPSGQATISTITDGSKDITTGGTPEAIAGSSTPFIRCLITSKEDNTDIIVIGSATVDATLASRTGTPLLPFSSLTIKNGDLNDFYADVEVNGEGLTYHCES